MKTVAHLSDLHFGAEDQAVADALADDLASVRPALVAVSGDLTQRAKRHQFRAARAWLDTLGSPWVAVPGNHDVPLFDVWRRTFRPRNRYRAIVHEETEPVWCDDELLVVGLDTTRRAVLKSGRLSEDQVARARRRLEKHGRTRLSMLVVHHPFAPSITRHGIVAGASRALVELSSAGLDLVLAGHHHVGFTGDLAEWHVGLSAGVLVSHAGTALSHRRRSRPNEWTRIDLEDDGRVRFEVREFDGRRFVVSAATRFRRVGTGWQRAG